MIKEITVNPKPRNNKAKLFFTVGMIITALSFILYCTMDKYRGIVGVIAIMAVSISVLIYTKFVAVDFYYDVTFDSDDAPIFVVRQITGRRQTTLCRIDIADIYDIKHETAAERKAHKRKNGTKLYVYAPTLLPEDSYRVVAKNRYDSFEMIIECDEEFASLLSAYAAEARAARALLDDEE